jgi:protein-S-isoprenylcysteine O-methyltransferase Ste14
MFNRLSIFLFGVVSYAVFFATFLYAVGFIGNFAVPRTLDGAPAVGFATALLVNLGLLGVFAVQHSVMARPGFKRWFTKLVPETAERSTYVLLSSLALIALFAYWQPLGGVVWAVNDPTLRGVLWGAFVFGWLLVLVSTFLINHFDLFGLRQVWLQLVNRPYTPLEFRTPGPYLFVRHPLYVGWLFAFWATPTMTISHLVFAIATTGYILIAIRFEERDLVAHHGKIYQEYVEKVPMLVPFTRKRNVDEAFLRRLRD